jgi:TRAP-type mannitol/chloroaromatic compound transport system permease large subunit
MSSPHRQDLLTIFHTVAQTLLSQHVPPSILLLVVVGALCFLAIAKGTKSTTNNNDEHDGTM